MTIRMILATLPKQDIQLLVYARETGLTNQTVEYQPGRFIGVNVLPDLMPHLVVDQTAGLYSEGAIVRGAICNNDPSTDEEDT